MRWLCWRKTRGWKSDRWEFSSANPSCIYLETFPCQIQTECLIPLKTRGPPYLSSSSSSTCHACLWSTQHTVSSPGTRFLSLRSRCWLCIHKRYKGAEGHIGWGSRGGAEWQRYSVALAGISVRSTRCKQQAHQWTYRRGQCSFSNHLMSYYLRFTSEECPHRKWLIRSSEKSKTPGL